MRINGHEIPEEVHKFLQEAVEHYLEEMEHTQLGAQLRRNEVLLNFLNHNDLEKIRTQFYLETLDIRCPKCNELVDNQDPDLVCFNCNQVINFLPSKAHAYDFCQETCTDTSMKNCQKYQRIKSHLEDEEEAKGVDPNENKENESC